MEASQPSHVNVEVAHVQSPPTDLVSGHVALAVAQDTNAPARKRQGNVVVEDGNATGPAGKACAPGAAAAARFARPPMEKMSKVSGMKRKKVPTYRSSPSSTPFAPARCSPTMPFNGAASTAGEVFNEMTGSKRKQKKREIEELHDLGRSNLDQGLECGVYGCLHWTKLPNNGTKTWKLLNAIFLN
ncbi:hypothetical protein D1007_09148 [Hordeum vulgare]|nr:hypothetical protein D1007_09148 [Hordeum vulgare]